MAYRSSPATQSTDFSPFFLLFGREMRLPIDVALQPKDNLSPDCKLFLGQVLQNVEICRKLAGENIEKAQDRYKQQYDKWTKLPGFRPAQRVWLYCTKVPVGKAPKLHRKWVGPYYITMVGPNHTYRLRNLATNKEVKSLVNAMRLKPYYDPADRPTNPPPELQNGEEELDPGEIGDIEVEQQEREQQVEQHQIQEQPYHGEPRNRDERQTPQTHRRADARNTDRANRATHEKQMSKQKPQTRNRADGGNTIRANRASKGKKQMPDRRPQTQDRADGRKEVRADRAKNNKRTSEQKPQTQVRADSRNGANRANNDIKRISEHRPQTLNRADGRDKRSYEETRNEARTQCTREQRGRPDQEKSSEENYTHKKKECTSTNSRHGEYSKSTENTMKYDRHGKYTNESHGNTNTRNNCQQCRNDICKTLRYPEGLIDRILISKRYNGLTYYKLKLKGQPSEWAFPCQFSNRLCREYHAHKTTQGRARKRPVNQNQKKFFQQHAQTVNFISQSHHQNIVEIARQVTTYTIARTQNLPTPKPTVNYFSGCETLIQTQDTKAIDAAMDVLNFTVEKLYSLIN